MKRFLILTTILLGACTSVPTQTPVSFFETAANPQTVEALQTVQDSSTQVISMPKTTLTGTAETSGELYFFLQPRTPGQSIQLASVSGVCISDPINCAPLKTITVPFSFNFTINPLAWSADGKYAAFAYSDHPNGTPTKLWRFDPADNTWASLAEFPYIDPPFWSPDGTKIAFRTLDGIGGENVYVINRDGTELRSISAGLPTEGRPYIMNGWYMNAGVPYIMMRSALPANSAGIYLVSASDGTARPMFEISPTKAQFTAAPDGRLLAYDESDSNTQNHSFKLIEPNGANGVTLANFNGGSLYPIVWSPNSQMIAFNYSSLSAGIPGAEVFIFYRNGNNLLSVYKGKAVGRLLFSPDGRYLLIEEITSATGGHLFLVNPITVEQKILQAPGLSTDYDWYAPSWRP